MVQRRSIITKGCVHGSNKIPHLNCVFGWFNASIFEKWMSPRCVTHTCSKRCLPQLLHQSYDPPSPSNPNQANHETHWLPWIVSLFPSLSVPLHPRKVAPQPSVVAIVHVDNPTLQVAAHHIVSNHLLHVLWQGYQSHLDVQSLPLQTHSSPCLNKTKNKDAYYHLHYGELTTLPLFEGYHAIPRPWLKMMIG